MRNTKTRNEMLTEIEKQLRKANYQLSPEKLNEKVANTMAEIKAGDDNSVAFHYGFRRGY